MKHEQMGTSGADSEQHVCRGNPASYDCCLLWKTRLSSQGFSSPREADTSGLVGCPTRSVTDIPQEMVAGDLGQKSGQVPRPSGAV